MFVRKMNLSSFLLVVYRSYRTVRTLAQHYYIHDGSRQHARFPTRLLTPGSHPPASLHGTIPIPDQSYHYSTRNLAHGVILSSHKTAASNYVSANSLPNKPDLSKNVNENNKVGKLLYENSLQHTSMSIYYGLQLLFRKITGLSLKHYIY